MRSFNIFIIRLIISIMFAFFVCRLFFQDMPLDKTLGLAFIMLLLAYLFEYLRNLGKEEENGN